MLNIDKNHKDADFQLVTVFDYDGVITKMGTSGVDEEKWLKREKNFFWRKLMYFISYIYDRFVPYNENISEVTIALKDYNGKNIIVSSHILTTSNYPESEKIRNLIIKRLQENNVLFDEIYFVSGNKVAICKELGAHLVIEDTVSKIKTLRSNNIPTIAKINQTNMKKLKNDPDTIEDLISIIPIAETLIENHKIINQANKVVNISKNNSGHSYCLDRGSAVFSSFSLIGEETPIMEKGFTKKLVPHKKEY